MADGDTGKTRIERLLFPKRKRTPKIIVSDKWYRKKLPTMNSKLSQAIIDAMPFDVDKEKADIILRAIFDSITDHVLQGELVAIPGFGKFRLSYHKGRYYHQRKEYQNGKHKLKIWKPGHYRVVFSLSRVILDSLRDKEPDGDSGTV